MPVLDASLIVALYKPGDKYKPAAQAWLDSALSEDDVELHAPSIILSEVGGVIARETQRSDLATAAAGGLRDNGIAIHDIDEHLATEAMKLAIEFKLRGADAIYVALAKRLGQPLVTFDKEQLSRPTIISTIEPPPAKRK